MSRLLKIGINTIRGFSGPAFNFLIALFGIKFFGKQDWGLMINALLWIFLIVFIISWGNREYLIRTFSKQPSRIYHSFYSNFITRSILLPFGLVLFLYFPFPIAFWSMALVILMHTYNAMDSLIIYYQKFGVQLAAEVTTSIIIISSIFYLDNFSLESFLKLYCLAFSLKIALLVTVLNFHKNPFSFQLSIKEFKAGFWFFTLGFSGWLISKIDIYIVDFYLTKLKLSEYQLLITSFLMLQAVSGFIIVPFTKHLYRLPKKTYKKIQNKLYILAIPIVILGGFSIWILMEQFVKLNLQLWYYILGTLMALPSFFYTLEIMRLMKTHQEKQIIVINCFGFIISTTLILFLINEYQALGVLLSVCITQWLLLIFYKLNARKSKAS
ncbi:hypothetical protein [Winogradskyella sp.]|uniref:lipopolysaccharide biosynthesis protein n=1 Tax=Winogradskyella sp. TaxID=1883156 RepID=UPI0025D87A01|nr:hypothetical protein [Winogradskyella sp.]